ncbi:MAG: hypothetical protein FWD52_02595 [Candidatus Bathyarchaeota archaeon]|nr:hypothetical protein [Candidatus Termiticorpusculum sp.]
MSFGNSLKGLGKIQEVLVLGLMVITMVALFYFDFDLPLKVGIAVLAFAMVLLTSIASQLLNMQKEAMKAQR